jgi:hypothetical protein
VALNQRKEESNKTRVSTMSASSSTAATTTKAKTGVKRHRNARRMPKEKRFAPREAPGLPGRGSIARYTAYLTDGALWVLDCDAARDLAQRGSYGKGVLSRSGEILVCVTV